MQRLRTAVHRRASLVRGFGWVALTVALIAGILTMHTISSVSHDADMTGSMPMPVAEAPMLDVHGDHMETVASAPSADTTMTMSACILALLLITLAFAAPSLLAILAPHRRPGAARSAVSAAARRARAPSLALLSIYRI